MSVTTCPACDGTRLKPSSRAVLVDGTPITDVNRMSIGDALAHFEGMEAELDARDTKIAAEILKEIRARLGFMTEVGLEYLTLDREASTLSGGIPAHPPRHPDRVRAGRRTVRPRRALH